MTKNFTEYSWFTTRLCELSGASQESGVGKFWEDRRGGCFLSRVGTQRPPHSSFAPYNHSHQESEACLNCPRIRTKVYGVNKSGVGWRAQSDMVRLWAGSKGVGHLNVTRHARWTAPFIHHRDISLVHLGKSSSKMFSEAGPSKKQ